MKKERSEREEETSVKEDTRGKERWGKGIMSRDNEAMRDEGEPRGRERVMRARKSN